jgi:hypothetical protein
VPYGKTQKIKVTVKASGYKTLEKTITIQTDSEVPLELEKRKSSGSSSHHSSGSTGSTGSSGPGDKIDL